MDALLAGKTDVNVEEFGRDIVVADDPKARLMYYIDSVCSVVDLSSIDNVATFRRYGRYNTLTERQQLELCALCELLSPDILNNKVFFQDDEMCGYDDNKFFKLNVVRHDILISEAIIIGGKRCAVRKIMAYKNQWLQWCYIQPMAQLRQTVMGRLREEEQRRAQQQQQQQQQQSSCVLL